MEKIEKGELVTLDDNLEYLVHSAVEDNGERFLYLYHEDKEVKIKIVKEIVEESGIKLEEITNPEEIQKISEKLLNGVE